MQKILFVCLGNICRSPMAEAIMRYILQQKGQADNYEIASAAVSEEEWGNPIYPPAARILRAHGIPYDTERIACQMKAEDYDRFDLIVGMDEANVLAIRRIAGGDPQNKVHMLMDYAGCHRAVADPWYTRDFETAYRDIMTGCQALYDHLMS